MNWESGEVNFKWFCKLTAELVPTASDSGEKFKDHSGDGRGTSWNLCVTKFHDFGS